MEVTKLLKLTIVSALFCQVSSPLSYGVESTKKYESLAAVQEKSFYQSKNKFKNQLTILKHIKNAIISGDLKKADRYHRRIEETKPLAFAVKERYRAIASFIREDYEKSLQILSSPIFYNSNAYRNICFIKIISMSILNKTEKLASEYDRCSALTAKYSPNEHYWMQNLVHAKLGDRFFKKNRAFKEFETQFHDNDFIAKWLKLALFLNKEKYVLKNIAKLPEQAYESIYIRDLIGLIYYRVGNPSMSKNFIEDSQSANAENIRGNIYLDEKKYELAYSHFKLALQKKRNSNNAIDRAIPLSWTLKQWQDGINLLEKIPKKQADFVKKSVLKGAFLTRMGKHQEAFNLLDDIFQYFPINSPQEFNQLVSYNSALQGNRNLLKKFAGRACRQYDALNCWLLMQNEIWEDLTKTITRDEKVNDRKKFTVESLKENVAEVTMQEDIFIDQRDIRELDDSLMASEY